MMKAILIDDEQLALDYLQHQLVNTVADLHILGMYTDPHEGKAAIEANEVDIVFLDIQMPEISGLELAEQILEHKPQLQIIFITAYDDYALSAFELDALDYLLKPVRQERLRKTIQRIKNRMGSTQVTSPKSATLQMNLFKRVAIFDEHHQEIQLRWRTTKVQQLFLYLLHHRGKMIDKFSLLELLWPEYEVKKGLAQLYTATYHIRKTLEPFGDHVKIKSMTDGYLLTIENIRLDVDEFTSFIQADLTLNDETVAQYERAIALFTGEYLEGFDYVWAESERQRLQTFWIHTCIQLIEWYLAQDQLEKVFQYAWELHQRYPLEEEANFLLMKLFARKGNHAAVIRQYSQLEQLLKEELGVQPSPNIREWYELWQKTRE